MLDQAPVALSQRALIWRRLRRDRVAMVALVTVVALVLVAAFAGALIDLLGLRPPGRQDALLYADAADAPEVGPHWTSFPVLGTDHLGRDVLSRILLGARTSLFVGVTATALALTAGLVTGMLAGYYRGWVDAVLGRVMDVALAVPIVLLALGLNTACSFGDGCLRVAGTALLRPGPVLVAIVIATGLWPIVARLVRGEVLSAREEDYVEAARALGASDARILVREVLPNLAGPLLVAGSALISVSVLAEAGLSYLGLGASGTPSWGAMLADATELLDVAWWFTAFPGLAIVLCVLAFNLLGDGVADAVEGGS